MTLQLLMAQLLNGAAFGFLLFLLASGLNLMFGLMGIVNLAHGSYFMIGAYAGLYVLEASGSFFLAIIAASLIGSFLGIFTERILLRRVYGSHHYRPILLTFGLCLFLSDFALFIWTGIPRWVQTPSFLAFSIPLAGGYYPAYRLAIIGVGIMVFVGFAWFQEKTLWGAIIRAGVDDQEMAMGLGINIPLVFSVVFSMGAFLAGFAGFLASPILGVHIGLDLEIIMLALAVVIVGGVGSLTGCLTTCLLFGIADTLGKVLWPDFASLTIYVIVVIVLLVWPSGLFGKGQ